MIERVRRIVMGEPEPGRSAFTHVEEVEPLTRGPASRWWLVWGWDRLPTLPHNPAEPYAPASLFPPAGGLRIWAQRMGRGDPGDTESDWRDAAEAVARLQAADPPGWTDDPSRPGMHRTDSIDIGVVVAGQVTVEAEDGSSVALSPGDVYIQNGAMHRWRPNPEDPGHVVFILIGAERAKGARAG